MSTYLYCLLTPPKIDSVPPGLVGIAGAPVRSLVLEGPSAIEAWVATVDDAQLRARGEAFAAQALLHNEIVNAALTTGRTPAPARYGSRFADDATCLADLERRHKELASVLAQLADTIEMGVLLVPTTSSRAPASRAKSAEPSAGRRYLESIRTRIREEEDVRTAAEGEAARIDLLVGDITRDSRRNMTPSRAMSIAYLIRRDSLSECRARLRSFQPMDRFRLVIGEPRAPYSFASPKAPGSGHESGSQNRSD
jgi:hypothetical protein